MKNVIYRAEDGTLQLGSASNEAELLAAVYTTDSRHEFAVEGGNFVERTLDGRSSRILCPTDR